jgi:hypothetical protein
MSPIAFLLFIAWIEWCITTDIEGETFRHIGQWGTLEAVVLALLGAMITRYSTVPAEKSRLCKDTSLKGIDIEHPPVFDTDDSESQKPATAHIKAEEVRSILYSCSHPNLSHGCVANAELDCLEYHYRLSIVYDGIGAYILLILIDRPMQHHLPARLRSRRVGNSDNGCLW